MEFDKLFQSLPDLIKLFVPGFIFLKTYRYFSKVESGDFEGTAVCSAIISYVFNLSLTSIPFLKNFSSSAIILLSLPVSFVSALLFIVFKRSPLCYYLAKIIGKVSSNDNIWQDIFDRNKGATIRCFTEYNHEEVMVEGTVRFFEACEDGQCNIALWKYKITYIDGTVYQTNAAAVDEERCLLYLNTSDIHGLEITHGQ